MDKVPDVLGEKMPSVCGWQASPPPTGPCVQVGKLLGLLTSTSASFTLLYEDFFRVSQLSKCNFQA